MGLFEKKTCIRCGKELGLIFGKTKIADGHICKDCNALLSPLLTGRAKLTLKDIEEHLKYREENKQLLNSFKASLVLGDYEKVYIDENQGKFVVYNGSNYIEKNIDVLSLTEISSCELKVDEDKKEIFNQDKDGNDVSYDPPRYETSYTYKIDFVLNHKWIKELTIDVSNGEVSQDDKEKLLEVDNTANQIMAKLTGKEFTAKTSMEEAADENHWTCPKCGQVNDVTSKFCTNCGEARNAGQKFCGECGTKLPEGTKFCPNCGKAVN